MARTDFVANGDPRLNKIDRAKNEVLRPLLQVFMRIRRQSDGKDVPLDANADTPARSYYSDFEIFCKWLETGHEMSPALQERTNLEQSIKGLLDRWIVPGLVRDRLQNVFDMLQQSQWETRPAGQGESDDDDVAGDTEEEDDSSTAPVATDRRGSASGIIHYPSDANRIWGVGGIMYGLARKFGNRKTIVIRDDLKDNQVNFREFGDRKLTLGEWFPRQLSAVFRGYHGRSQHGIHGSAKSGAYSIVIGGSQYEGIDKDLGDIVYYSGPEAATNTSQKSKKSRETLYLHLNLAALDEKGVEKPVRVLRKAGGKYGYSPSVGLRYDGLYTVTGVEEATNSLGGSYDLFKLERVAGQVDLNGLQGSRPSATERTDYDRIADEYVPQRKASV